MTEIVDLGKVTVPDCWEKVTLKQFSEIVTLYESEDKNTVDILSIFTGKSREELNSMPSDFVVQMLALLLFLEKPIDVKPDNKIVIDKTLYTINYKEKLKFGEFCDAETALKDKDYATLLAVLCRKEGEIYNDEFIANTLESRVAMFNSLPITEAYRLLGFFLKLSLNSINVSRLPLTELKHQTELLVQSIESSLKPGLGNWYSTLCAKIKLRKLKKSLKSI